MEKIKEYSTIIFMTIMVCGCSGPNEEPVVKSILPGLYEYQENWIFNQAEDGFTGTGNIKGQITLSANKTFLLQAFYTVNGTAINDLPLAEEKGNYGQSGEIFNLSETLERRYVPETSTWTAWGVPKDGRVSEWQIRNVTSATFKKYVESRSSWITFSKL